MEKFHRQKDQMVPFEKKYVPVEDLSAFKSSRKVEQETVVVGSSKPRTGTQKKPVSSTTVPKSTPVPTPAPIAQASEKDPQKAIRALQKKLRQIESIIESQKNGAELNEDQLKKVAMKSEILKEIQELEKLIQ